MNTSHLDKHRLTKSQEEYLTNLKTELEKYSKEVLEKLSILKTFTETRDVRQLLQDNSYETCFELFHGIDGYDMICEALSLYDVLGGDWESQRIFTKWETILGALSYQDNLSENNSLNYLYKDVREEIIWEKREAILFKWLTKLWHQTGLHRKNISAYTVQNNSVEMFDLNRCCWHDYLPEGDKNHEQVYQRSNIQIVISPTGDI